MTDKIRRVPRQRRFALIGGLTAGIISSVLELAEEIFTNGGPVSLILILPSMPAQKISSLITVAIITKGWDMLGAAVLTFGFGVLIINILLYSAVFYVFWYMKYIQKRLSYTVILLWGIICVSSFILPGYL